jgi:hypothetical protein
MTGGYVASFFNCAWPLDTVRGLLPAGLDLAPQSVTAPDLHPVLMGFGRQENVTMEHLGWLPIFPMNYLEYFIGIPAVQRRGCGPYHEPYLYMARLYLNSFLPVLGGVLFWGFPKELAVIKQGPGHFQVSTLRGQQPLISLESTATGDFSAALAHQNFAFVGGLLGQRLVEKSLDAHGPLLSATMTWDLAQAELRPLQATMEIASAFLPGLPTGRFESPTPGIDQNPMGAFELRTTWRLSLPFRPGKRPAPGA